MNIKKGDNVKVLSGNDKGKQGKVIAVLPDTRRIVVDGVNMKKKHVRPKRQDKKGEIIHVALSFPASRVMVICPKCSKQTRVKHAMNDAGGKARVCSHCGGEL